MKSFIFLVLAVLSWKYMPIFKNKVNYEYQKRFNIVIFSKENAKKPFMAALLILVGTMLHNSANTAQTSSFINGGTILIIGAICIMINVIYETYKKTDPVWGTYAAGLYLFLLIIQVMFGVAMIALVMGAIIFLAMVNNHDDRDYY